jgi:hypothetical protein
MCIYGVYLSINGRVNCVFVWWDSAGWQMTWFFSDHLGSTSTTVDAGGAVIGQQRYDP